MHTAALLLALSLSVHAVPVLHARGNDTVERREEGPYKVVNVAGPTTPVVETITATNPPAPPTTITVTEYPSSTPASVPGASPSSWNAGPAVGGAPLDRRDTNSTLSRRRLAEDVDATNSTLTRRGLIADAGTTNSTLSRRRLLEDVDAANKTASRRDITLDATNSTLSRRGLVNVDATNSTENHAIAARSNDTVVARSLLSDARNETEHALHALQARSNTTSEVFARGNDTIARVVARSNDTVSKMVAREIEGSKVALNSSKVFDHKGRSLNETALQARAFNDTPSDSAVMSSRLHARSLNSTDSQA
ncbi:hypothetical protein AbraIFM66951_000139 [Aspergillus brasiliensis]|uniref:Uncharacterized protein n=1 Tax=Aspergillus brasiliensis TaxID=319629 RepID=A0A9W6DIG4_9EURO|nr:hypothetical protein AbraCBS73388_000207 [Aspergillus brasiliensis]GKZ40377.1 hypothetical protein AbraIFM66951_000139 [Aspergillus brasiliensis]